MTGLPPADMRISVVVPSHNRRQSLPRALRSVFEQTSPVDEVILVDDGSVDGSAEMVSRDFPGVTIIGQPNQGVSAARNRGIEAASGEWIALLDSDDSWQAHKIATIRDHHRDNPDFVLVHSDEIWIRRGTRVNPKRKHRKRGGWIFEYCLPLCPISPSATLIRRSTLLDLGMFDESLPACEDYDLWLRICHRFPVYYIDEPLVTRYAGHDDQLSRRYAAMDRFRLRSLHRLLSSGVLGPRQREATRSMLLYKIDILLKGAARHRNQALIDEFTPLRERWSGRVEEAIPC